MIDYGTTECWRSHQAHANIPLIGAPWFIRHRDGCAHQILRMKLEPLSEGGTIPKSG